MQIILGSTQSCFSRENPIQNSSEITPAQLRWLWLLPKHQGFHQGKELGQPFHKEKQCGNVFTCRRDAGGNVWMPLSCWARSSKGISLNHKSAWNPLTCHPYNHLSERDPAGLSFYRALEGGICAQLCLHSLANGSICHYLHSRSCRNQYHLTLQSPIQATIVQITVANVLF